MNTLVSILKLMFAAIEADICVEEAKEFELQYEVYNEKEAA